jgi:ubiquitin-protein ligase
MPATPPKQCLSRLRKELQALTKDPLPNITAYPLDENILEWHYMIRGPAGSPFHGGCYHGKLKFPSEYPFKPPAIYMLTPNGRFKPNQKLCLSMSDFHPETWNPLWSVSSVITGLYTFWLDNAPTVGSMQSTDEQKRRYAIESWAFNRRDPVVRQLFPELLESPEPLPTLPAGTPSFRVFCSVTVAVDTT